MDASSTEPRTHYLCYNIEVALSDNTFGHLVSDAVLCVFDVILMLVTIVANSLAISSYNTTVILQTPSNCLLTMLSVVDILLATIVQPMFLVWRILDLDGRFSCGVFLALLLTINLLGAVSFLIAGFLISLERYYAIFYPLEHSLHTVSKSFFKIVVLAGFFVWLVFLLGTFLGEFHGIYVVVAVAVVNLCLLGSAVAYTRIFQELSRRHHAISNESISEDERDGCDQSRDKKVMVNVVFIIGAMTLLYAPIGGCAVYAVVIGRDWLYINYFVPWAYLLVFTSAAVNPFLYGWTSRGIWRSIRVHVITNAFEETGV